LEFAQNASLLANIVALQREYALSEEHSELSDVERRVRALEAGAIVRG
jgi:hypothetical protein